MIYLCWGEFGMYDNVWKHSLTLHDPSAEEQSFSNSNPPHFTHSKDEFKPHSSNSSAPQKTFSWLFLIYSTSWFSLQWRNQGAVITMDSRILFIIPEHKVTSKRQNNRTRQLWVLTFLSSWPQSMFVFMFEKGLQGIIKKPQVNFMSDDKSLSTSQPVKSSVSLQSCRLWPWRELFQRLKKITLVMSALRRSCITDCRCEFERIWEARRV